MDQGARKRRRSGMEARLNASPGGSRSALSGVGDVAYMDRGFAEAGVEHQKKRERRSAKYWRWATIIVAILGVSGITFRPFIERAWDTLQSILFR